MIFRADADQAGEIREMDTPDEHTLISNLEQVTDRWKDVNYDNGEAVLNEDLLHEIKNLKEQLKNNSEAYDEVIAKIFIFFFHRMHITNVSRDET